jgi:hypothetical protein
MISVEFESDEIINFHRFAGRKPENLAYIFNFSGLIYSKHKQTIQFYFFSFGEPIRYPILNLNLHFYRFRY